MSALLASGLQTRWTALLFLQLKSTLGYTEVTLIFVSRSRDE